MKDEDETSELLAEHRLEGCERIAGVTHDGERVWAADVTRRLLVAIDPVTGREVRRLNVPVDAGTAFDGRHLHQAVDGEILAIDPESGACLGRVPAPPGHTSGLAFAEGALWVGDYAGRTIQKIDPVTGRVLRTIRCDRFVTGVTFAAGELWHGTDEGETSDLRRLDPATGAVLETLAVPAGVRVSGLEADREGRLWLGDRKSGTLRAVRRRR